MNTRITLDQLQHMKTHELADLLANVVLLLRRMPNVEWSQLEREIPETSFSEQRETSRQSSEPSTLTLAELRKKTVSELRQIAGELRLPIPTRMKKEDLISKILTRAAHGRSEQYAIQDI